MSSEAFIFHAVLTTYGDGNLRCLGKKICFDENNLPISATLTFAPAGPFSRRNLVGKHGAVVRKDVQFGR